MDRQKYRESLVAVADGSPFHQLIGLRLIDVGESRARFAMPAETILTNSYGQMHGGAIASIADVAAGFSVRTLLVPGERVTTIEIKLNYIRPVSQGKLTAEGRIVQKGKFIAVAETHVWQDEGRTVARGLATFIISQD